VPRHFSRIDLPEPDVNLLLITDSVDQAMEHIRTQATAKFGLIRATAPRRRWWLWENIRLIPSYEPR
jgi:hypothetical protein